MSLSLMKQRIEQSGDTLWEEQIIDGQQLLKSDFVNDVSYNPNIIRFNMYDKCEKISIPIKMYGQDYSSSYGITTKFLSQIDTPVLMGDMLYDTKRNEYWMCVESYNVSNIHYEGVLGKCSRYLKWQDSNFNIFELPVIITSASKYNNGENANENIVLGSDQLLIFLQFNKDTCNLERGMKFFIDEKKENPTVYNITRVDTALYTYFGQGFMSMIVTEYPYTPTQKELELGICNYVNHDPVTDVSNNVEYTGISATISGEQYLKIGLPCIYKVNFKTNDKTLGWNQVSFEWDIESNIDVQKTIVENQIELLVQDNESLIGEIIILSVIVSGVPVCQIPITVIERF